MRTGSDGPLIFGVPAHVAAINLKLGNSYSRNGVVIAAVVLMSDFRVPTGRYRAVSRGLFRGWVCSGIPRNLLKRKAVD